MYPILLWPSCAPGPIPCMEKLIWKVHSEVEPHNKDGWDGAGLSLPLRGFGEPAESEKVRVKKKMKPPKVPSAKNMVFLQKEI